MPANLPFIGSVALYDEVVPFTPPANAAAWATEARFQFIFDSLDVSILKPAAVDDLRSQEHLHGRELMRQGLRNGEFPFQVYATGTGVTTADGVQVAETVLSRLLENGLGGISRSNSTTAAAAGAHSTTAIEMTADTNMAEGDHIGWQHPTTGQVHIRRLIENTGTTVWTLDEALPISAADGDIIHGAITLFCDQDIVANSNVTNRQLSYWIGLGDRNISTDETWVTIGCVNTVGALNMPRGELPTFDFTVMLANMVIPGDTPAPPAPVAWSADPVGVAPAVVGPEGRVFFQDNGTTTQTTLCLSELSVDPGVPRTRVETITESSDNAQGTCHYSVSKADSALEFTLTGFETDEFVDWNAETFKQFRTQAGVSPGFCFAVGCAAAEVMEAPSRAVQNDSSARSVKLRPHLGTKPSTNPFTTDTDLTRAPLYFVLA